MSSRSSFVIRSACYRFYDIRSVQKNCLWQTSWVQVLLTSSLNSNLSERLQYCWKFDEKLENIKKHHAEYIFTNQTSFLWWFFKYNLGIYSKQHNIVPRKPTTLLFSRQIVTEIRGYHDGTVMVIWRPKVRFYSLPLYPSL